MADHGQGNGAMSHIAPPQQLVTDFTVTVMPHGFHVTFGQQRVLIPLGGQPQGDSQIEWQSTIVLGAITLKGLLNALQRALSDYEAEYGQSADVLKILKSEHR